MSAKLILNWVPARRTLISFDEAAGAMDAALGLKLGKEPPREVLALALGKTALETGRWRSMYNFNFGNIRPRANGDDLYTCFPLCNEVEKDKKVHWYAPEGEVVSRANRTVIGKRYETPPGHPASRFRAWENASEAATAYVDFVAGGRYASAWQRLLAGDAAGYATELRRKGYYTAPLAVYLQEVVSLQREFIGKLARRSLVPVSDTIPAPPPTPPPPPPGATDGEIQVLALEALAMSDALSGSRDERDAQLRSPDD